MDQNRQYSDAFMPRNQTLAAERFLQGDEHKVKKDACVCLQPETPELNLFASISGEAQRSLHPMALKHAFTGST